MTDDGILRGELRDTLVAALGRLPELAGRELVLTALSGGITNRNFLVTVPGDRRPLRHPPGRQRHAPARHQPRGRARGHGGRGGRRGRAGGDRVHPARGLPRHALHRGLTGQRRGGPTAGDAGPGRRVPAAHPRRAADPRPVRAAAHRGGVSGARRRPAGSRSRPSTSSPPRSGAASSWPASPRRSSRGRATTTCSTRTSSTTARGSGSSTGSTPGWATRSSTSATSASTTS